MLPKCKEFVAWIDEMPPEPDTFNVTGEVVVANPGVNAALTMRQPPEFNPTIAVMDLNLIQQPGDWTQNMVCAPVKYSQNVPDGAHKYTSVEIYWDGGKIIIDKVDITS